MAEQSLIGWTDATFNPWMGCTKVSPGCEHCYASVSQPVRAMKIGWGPGQPRRRTSAANWKAPLRWNKRRFMECLACGWRGECAAEICGCDRCGSIHHLKDTRRRVFCASLADVFDNEVPEQWRFDLLNLISDTPNLDWLILTKRIGNARAMLDAYCRSDGNVGQLWESPWPNVWLGSTIVNHEEMLRDAGKLKAVPAAVHFWSVEPMLGPLGEIPLELMPEWVIVGGESDQQGMRARDFNIEDARSIVTQCKAAGVPVFVKQLGSNPYIPEKPMGGSMFLGRQGLALMHRSGADPSEWPEDVRVQEFPR